MQECNLNEKMSDFFMELLKKQYNEEYIKNIIDGISINRAVTLRVNTLKSNIKEIKETLHNYKIEFEEVPWSENALIIKNAKEQDLQELDIYKNGEIYLQSLSSMLPPIVLNPVPGEDILDMCAAPRRENYTNCSIDK